MNNKLFRIIKSGNKITPSLINKYKDYLDIEDENGFTVLMYLCKYSKYISNNVLRKFKSLIGEKNNMGMNAFDFLFINYSKRGKKIEKFKLNFFESEIFDSYYIGDYVMRRERDSYILDLISDDPIHYSHLCDRDIIDINDKIEKIVDINYLIDKFYIE